MLYAQPYLYTKACLNTIIEKRKVKLYLSKPRAKVIAIGKSRLKPLVYRTTIILHYILY